MFVLRQLTLSKRIMHVFYLLKIHSISHSSKKKVINPWPFTNRWQNTTIMDYRLLWLANGTVPSTLAPSDKTFSLYGLLASGIVVPSLDWAGPRSARWNNNVFRSSAAGNSSTILRYSMLMVVRGGTQTSSTIVGWWCNWIINTSTKLSVYG